MALFLGYDALYLGPKMKRERERKAAAAALLAEKEAPARTATDTIGSPSATPEGLDVPADADTAGIAAAERFAKTDSTQAVVEKTVVVASPLFELTFSSLGGDITSARLLKYHTKEEPVELLERTSWNGDRLLTASVKSETGTLPLDRVSFEITSNGAVVSDGARVDVGGPTEVVFRAASNGGVVERAYRFQPDRYDFEASVRVLGTAFPGASSVTWSFGPGLRTIEANASNDHQAFRASVLLGEELHRKKPGDFGRKESEAFSGTLNFASVQSKYFLAAMYPAEPTRAEIEIEGRKLTHEITQHVTLPATTTAGDATQSMRVYLGPLDYKGLEGLGVGLERNVELGWNLIRPVSAAVLWCMVQLHKVIPNYGWVIVIISILAKVLFYRLTHKSFKSMKEMQDLQPRMQALKEKYGNDKRRMSEETMRLYKEAGVNPLGGCLPMLLQMPVFIALYNVLNYTIELRGAPFFGWINDLSQQDVLFRMPFSIPFLGDAFSLLPLLMGGAMFAQTKLGGSPTGAASPMPPGYNTILPIVMTFFFYKMPSGLVIYWIINTVLSVAQQYYVVKSHPAPAAVVVQEAPAKKKKTKRG